MKKLVALVTALFILASLSGAAFAETTYTSGGVSFTLSPEGYPIMSEPIELSILCFSTTPQGEGAWETPNDVAFFKNMEERTNIHFNWEVLTYGAWKERVQLLIAGDEMPDVFIKTAFSDADLVKNGLNGTILDLNPYLETYAPDFYKYMTERDLLKYITMDGGVWGLPYLFDSQGIRLSKIFVNTEWLKNVGKEMPSTWADMYDVLCAFRDQDANGNGDATDEVPAGFQTRDNMLRCFAGEFGLMNRGSSMGGQYIDADPADETGNTLRFWYADEALKGALRMAKQYYDEGLIPSNFFDKDYSDNVWWTKVIDNQCGFHTSYATITQTYVDQYIAMNRAPSDLWSQCSGYLSTKGGLVLSKECKYPEAMVAWGNYMYTTQGAYDYCLGIEGETYVINEDGTTSLTDFVLNNPNGLNTEQTLLRYTIYSGGANPALLTDNTFKGGETYWTSLEGNAKFGPYAPETIWERFPLSAEQTEMVSGVKGDIDAVIAEYCANFIVGRLDIDAGWDEYIGKLKQAGMEDYVWAYQEAYNTVNGL